MERKRREIERREIERREERREPDLLGYSSHTRVSHCTAI